jgi:hypothetical protein
LGGIKYKIELELRDKDGKLIKKHIQDGHTYVYNFLALLRVPVAYSNDQITTITGSSASGNPTTSVVQLAMNGGYGDTGYGIVIGTSDTPYNPMHYKLQNQISHGSSSGQMLYGVTTIEVPQSLDGSYRVVTSRVFTNSSGASITVKEIGIYSRISGTSDYCMIARDVITPTAVANGQSLTVRYIFTVSST